MHPALPYLVKGRTNMDGRGCTWTEGTNVDGHERKKRTWTAADGVDGTDETWMDGTGRDEQRNISFVGFDILRNVDVAEGLRRGCR